MHLVKVSLSNLETGLTRNLNKPSLSKHILWGASQRHSFDRLSLPWLVASLVIPREWPHWENTLLQKHNSLSEVGVKQPFLLSNYQTVYFVWNIITINDNLPHMITQPKAFINPTHWTSLMVTFWIMNFLCKFITIKHRTVCMCKDNHNARMQVIPRAFLGGCLLAKNKNWTILKFLYSDP